MRYEKHMHLPMIPFLYEIFLYTSHESDAMLIANRYS